VAAARRRDPVGARPVDVRVVALHAHANTAHMGASNVDGDGSGAHDLRGEPRDIPHVAAGAADLFITPMGCCGMGARPQYSPTPVARGPSAQDHSPGLPRGSGPGWAGDRRSRVLGREARRGACRSSRPALGTAHRPAHARRSQGGRDRCTSAGQMAPRAASRACQRVACRWTCDSPGGASLRRGRRRARLALFSAVERRYFACSGQGIGMVSSSRMRRWVPVSRSSTIPSGV
jgi:hypothetical protein